AYPGGIENKPTAAIHYHRKLAARRHFNRMRARPSRSRRGVVGGYLWYHSHRWHQARIIRKTPQRLFLARSEMQYGGFANGIFNPKEYEEHPEWFHTAALNREKLERKGQVWSHSSREFFYTDEGKRNQEAEWARWRSPGATIPAFLAALGL